MSYRFRELREKAGLTTAELAKRIGVSQAAASQWDTGKKFPSSETLCKLADLYCVSIDYLVGRESADPGVPVKADIIPTNTLLFMHGKPVWDETRGWGVVNAAMDYVIFMDGTKIVLAEAMNLRAMAPAYTMGYSPTAKPIFHGAGRRPHRYLSGICGHHAEAHQGCGLQHHSAYGHYGTPLLRKLWLPSR